MIGVFSLGCTVSFGVATLLVTDDCFDRLLSRSRDAVVFRVLALRLGPGFAVRLVEASELMVVVRLAEFGVSI